MGDRGRGSNDLQEERMSARSHSTRYTAREEHSQHVPLERSSHQVRMLRERCGMGNEAGTAHSATSDSEQRVEIGSMRLEASCFAMHMRATEVPRPIPVAQSLIDLPEEL